MDLLQFHNNGLERLTAYFPNALRFLMAIAIAGAVHTTTIVSGHTEPALQAIPEESSQEEEAGMGMAYLTPIALSLDYFDMSDSLLEGVLEPQEYSRVPMLIYTSHRIVQGDTIGGLAMRFGLRQDTLISVNNIQNSRLLQIGQVIRVPNQDGIVYTLRSGDTLQKISEQHRASIQDIQTVNELFSEKVNAGTTLFIPGARLDYVNLQEINGDLFMWPIRGRITSPYGYRIDPIGKVVRQFHTGLDIAAPLGTPVGAAMAGRVSAVGYNASSGNYVIINHHSGYRSFYAHLSVIRVRTGAYVEAGSRIGDVGSTGASTGSHLHFTVYKNGLTVNPRNYLH